MRVAFIGILSIYIVAIVMSYPTNAQPSNDFIKYINDARWDYQNVLILGVGADWTAALELEEKYSFDKVIAISEDRSNPIDFMKAALEKGIQVGTLAELQDKKIKSLYAHSWGSSRAVNFLSEMKVGQLHCIGSPESAVLNQTLIGALDKGNVGKVFFHINEGDKVAFLRHIPKLGLQGGFTGKIEFHFYRTNHTS